MHVVEDDCALPRDKGITGRRGVAGTVLVAKVAGAAAEAGMSLDEVGGDDMSVFLQFSVRGGKSTHKFSPACMHARAFLRVNSSSFVYRIMHLKQRVGYVVRIFFVNEGEGGNEELTLNGSETLVVVVVAAARLDFCWLPKS